MSEENGFRTAQLVELEDNFDDFVGIYIDNANWGAVLRAEYVKNDDIEGKSFLYRKAYESISSWCDEFPEGHIVAYRERDLRDELPPMDVRVAWKLDEAYTPQLVIEPSGMINSRLIAANCIADVPKKYHGLVHDPDGNMLVCFSIAVRSEDRGKGVPELLIPEQLKLAKKLGIKHVIAYSRPGNYGQYVEQHGEIPIEKYLEIEGSNLKIKDEKGRPYDKAIGMHLRLGGKIGGIFYNARPGDKFARGYNVIVDYAKEVEKLKLEDAPAVAQILS
jgi:N-acetylglutamate synthase-like GNAT family acetyltransferase